MSKGDCANREVMSWISNSSVIPVALCRSSKQHFDTRSHQHQSWKGDIVRMHSSFVMRVVCILAYFLFSSWWITNKSHHPPYRFGFRTIFIFTSTRVVTFLMSCRTTSFFNFILRNFRQLRDNNKSFRTLRLKSTHTFRRKGIGGSRNISGWVLLWAKPTLRYSITSRALSRITRYCLHFFLNEKLKLLKTHFDVS